MYMYMCMQTVQRPHIEHLCHVCMFVYMYMYLCMQLVQWPAFESLLSNMWAHDPQQVLVCLHVYVYVHVDGAMACF